MQLLSLEKKIKLSLVDGPQTMSNDRMSFQDLAQHFQPTQL